MSAHFKAVDRETIYLFPPSVQDWLPEKHLARFVVDVVSKLDLHELKMPYSGGGSEAYHPEMLLALLFYGYATGVFPSRKLEQATYDSIAFRYIAANTHPDHDTLATFRKRFLEQLKPLFLQILLLAKMLGFLRMGKISLDGSKFQANASKHSALSWGHATELEQQLKEEVARLMAMAEAADLEAPEGMDIPAELAQRDQRLKAIAEAKAKLEARAAERYAAEQAEYEAKKTQRQAKAQLTGRPPKGPEPKPPEPGVRDSDQINLTDEESRIMPTSGKSFQQAYNVQAGVESEKPVDCYRARDPKRQRQTRSGTHLKGPGATGPTAGQSRSAAG
jgi:transposase